MDEVLNSQAYDDVLDCKTPSLPQNKEYMGHYNFWRQFQPFFSDDNQMEEYNERESKEVF